MSLLNLVHNRVRRAEGTKSLLLMILLFISLGLIGGHSIADNSYYYGNYGSFYIGSCILHDDYGKSWIEEDYPEAKGHIKYTRTEVLPYDYPGPGKEYLNSLTPFQQKLFILLVELQYGEYADREMRRDDCYIFDDISMDTIHLKDEGLNPRPEATLYRWKYGSGGGNGGHMVFAVTKEGAVEEKIELVFESFDGDLLFCHEDYRVL